jgi:hypothetical protein
MKLEKARGRPLDHSYKRTGKRANGVLESLSMPLMAPSSDQVQNHDQSAFDQQLVECKYFRIVTGHIHHEDFESSTR